MVDSSLSPPCNRPSLQFTHLVVHSVSCSCTLPHFLKCVTELPLRLPVCSSLHHFLHIYKLEIDYLTGKLTASRNNRLGTWSRNVRTTDSVEIFTLLSNLTTAVTH